MILTVAIYIVGFIITAIVAVVSIIKESYYERRQIKRS
jgi:hypothetical protein